MAISGIAGAEYLLTQIGKPYDEQDCIEAVVVNPIRKLPGGKKDYRIGGCTALWSSAEASEKYRDITDRIPINEAIRQGLLIGDLPVIYNAANAKCEHIAYYMGGIGGYECIHSSETKECVCGTTLKNGFTHVLRHRYITGVAVGEADDNQTEGESTMSAICKMRVELDSGYLNLRDEPSIQGRDIGDIPNGAIVEVLVDGAWPFIRYEGKTGYVSGNYLRVYDGDEDIPVTNVENIQPDKLKTCLIRRSDNMSIILDGDWRVADD